MRRLRVREIAPIHQNSLEDVAKYAVIGYVALALIPVALIGAFFLYAEFGDPNAKLP